MADLVTYDLNRPGKNYEGVLKVIKSFSWARLSESSYAVSGALTAQALYDRLKPHLDASDNLYVIPLGRPYAGFGPKDVNEWLERNL